MRFWADEKIERLLRDIKAGINRETYPIPAFQFAEGQYDDAHRPDFDDAGWRTFHVGDTWGGYDVYAWFRAWVDIPPHLQGERLGLRFLVGPRDGGDSTAEALLYVNGAPLQAIDVWHDEAWLPPEIVKPGRMHLALRAWSGVIGVPDRRRFKVAELNRVDAPSERLYYLADTLLQAIRLLTEGDWRREAILKGLDDALRLVDFTKPRSEAYYASIRAACDRLQAHVDSLRGQERGKPTVTAVGHAHIDMAWLWQLKDTRDKAARTFMTALHLMRQYPEYRFLHSSPQLYEYLETDYPEVFEQVKARIASGEWEITGGMWIESDVNIPNGESLIRQFLLGRRYIRDTFGKETRLLWLPDVFGYSWALPQILKGCGIDTFMTTKISWSQFNRFPYDTFHWRGIDGTEVLTHFITTPEPSTWFYTYNGQLRPQDIKGIWDAYRQQDVNDDLLLAFGWGDGGGGPTREMLEQARALQDLPGFPRVTMGTAEPYFDRLTERVKDAALPVWDGELYLEYHRGTYTSQAANKRRNRESEILYHHAEWLSVLADDLRGTSAYPHDDLRTGWKLILLNQFHDILPGSSIKPVYEDSQRDYDRIQAIGEAALLRAVDAIRAGVAAEQPSVIAFNGLSWSRGDLLALDADTLPAGQTLALADGSPAPVQIAADGTRLVEVDAIPAYGYRVLPLTGAGVAADHASTLHVSPALLENEHYRITLNATGQITSLWDKTYGREVIAAGQTANRFITFQDIPIRFDAWDIDLYYQEKPVEITELVAAEVEETGPLRATLRLQWRFYDSTITQRISIYRQSRRIDFRTEIDWQERQILLKTAFPVAIRSTRATYDIQFGAIERATHWNTSWDYARFEVVGHKWADLSEGNYGVSLLNDCKYGYDIKDNVIRLTLLKSAIDPDPTADLGRHEFTYSLLPHGGIWQHGDTLREGYALNMPLIAAPVAANPGGPLPSQTGFASVTGDGVIIETVKQAEDARTWIVRVYEGKGYRQQGVALAFARPIRAVNTCNLVEEDAQPYPHEGDRITFDLRPYEIRTFEVSL